MATQTLEETTTTPEVESQVGSSSSERQTRERKKVKRFSLPTPIPNKSVSIEKVITFRQKKKETLLSL